MADDKTDVQVTDTDVEDPKLANLVNRAVTGQLKRHMGKFQETFSGELAGLKELLQGQKAAEQPKPEQGGGKGDPEAMAEIAKLRESLKKEQEERKREKRLAREEKAFGELRTALTGKVRPEALDVAAKLLFQADKRVTVKEDGSISFRHGEDNYDLQEGLQEWLKSNDSALFRPPPAAQQKKGQPQPRGMTGTNGSHGAETPLERTKRQLEALNLK